MAEPGEHGSRGGLLDRWQKMVDPRGLFEGRLGELATTLGEINTQFVDSSLLRGVGRKTLGLTRRPVVSYSGMDSVFADVASLQPISQNNAAEFITALQTTDSTRGIFRGNPDIATERFLNIAGSVEQQTDQVADDIVHRVHALLGDGEQADELRESYAAELGVNITKDTSPLVAAGLLMASLSHEGQTRKNERRPFVSHPVAAAYLYEMAWNKAAEQQSPPERKWLHREQFLLLMHDTIENQMKRDGTSYMRGESTRITPLLVQRVLEKLGEGDEAGQLVEDQLTITKTFGIDGKGLENGEYLQQYKRSTIRAMIGKFVDTVHNKIIDPKNEANTELLDKEYAEILAHIEANIRDEKRDRFGLETVKAMYEIAMGNPSVGHPGYVKNHTGFMEMASRFPLGQM